MNVSDTLRAAVQAAVRGGTTRYRIATDAGVDQTALRRFLAEGRDVRVSTVDRLAAFLNLKLAAKKTEKAPKECRSYE